VLHHESQHGLAWIPHFCRTIGIQPAHLIGGSCSSRNIEHAHGHIAELIVPSLGTMQPQETPRTAANLFEVVTEDGRASVMVTLPEEPPPSNYIPMDSRVLERKLGERFKGQYIQENLRVLSRRIGLRCSLRCKIVTTSCRQEQSRRAGAPTGYPVLQNVRLICRNRNRVQCIRS
jgi:hypothetical protein